MKTVQELADTAKSIWNRQIVTPHPDVFAQDIVSLYELAYEEGKQENQVQWLDVTKQVPEVSGWYSVMMRDSMTHRLHLSLELIHYDIITKEWYKVRKEMSVAYWIALPPSYLLS